MFQTFARPAVLASVLLASAAAQVAASPTGTASNQQADGAQIRLVYGAFDPTKGEPGIPELLRSTNEQGLWIVQLKATPTESDRVALRSVGGEIIGYLPDNAYLVRMAQDQAATATDLTSVRWVGNYHVAYRLAPSLLQAGLFVNDKPALYNLVVANKHTDKPGLIAKIRAIGGVIESEQTGSLLLNPVLTGPQLLKVAGFDEVLWLEPCGERVEFMDNARIQGGANFVEAAGGYTGAGVNSHVYEGVEPGHPDFSGSVTTVQSAGIAHDHGHATGGIMWGNGTSNPAVRGLAPDSGKFYTEYQTTTASRYQILDDLVNIHDVSMTSSSWGWLPLVLGYSGRSAEADDMIFDHDLVWTQSQANDGTQLSAGSAWAKNIFSIGGVFHSDDSNPANDSWGGGASIGPSADGRIKPTLTAYFDGIGCSDRTGALGYSNLDWFAGFSGTSGAAPIVGGHNVLAIQMFTDDTGTPGVGKFGNTLRVSGGTAHENRPHFPTLKSLMVVSATQYDFGPASTDNRREHQGWGFPDLQTLYERRDMTFIVDETEVLNQGDIDFWQITVSAGEPSLKISLNWSEPPSNPAAAAALINNLSLKVIAPNGLEYWGNVGLANGLWSVAGGSEDMTNSIENVFVENPVAGDWYVQVIGTSIVEDNHVETQGVDADYALVAVGGNGGPAPPGVFGEVEIVGQGCDGVLCLDAVYEYPSFSMANNSLTLAYTNGDYELVPGQGTWVPPAGQNMGLGDNQELVRNIGFTQPYPGGQSGTITVCSNGWITPGPFLGGSNVSPTTDDFLSQAMWAPMWRDLNPGAGGSVWFDSTASRLIITWLSVPNFSNTGSSTFQIQFWPNGDVHYIYQNITVAGDYLVGFSKGIANDPGSINMAAGLNSGIGICQFSNPEMRFETSARPVLGTTFDLVTSNIPAGTILGMALLSVTELNPAISLTGLGMPGCELYQTIDVSVFWTQSGATAVLPWPLPSNPTLAAVQVFAQSASLTPGINPFEFAVSNGLKLTVGIN